MGDVQVRGMPVWVSLWGTKVELFLRTISARTSLRLNYEGGAQSFVVQSKRGTSGDCLVAQDTEKLTRRLLL